MPIDKKKIMIGAAVAGLIVGSSAAMAMGKAPERNDDSAKTESADKHGCGGAHGCGGKNGCPGKE